MDLMGFTFTLFVSIFAGALIGMERQWRHKLAGMRTTALVCLGATLFVRLSVFLQDDTSPTRIAAQVVSGIGFLAGGVIIREGFTVTGINTAATLWCSAAVGTLIGGALLYEGLIGALLIMSVNTILRHISKRVDRLSDKQQSEESSFHLSIICVRECEMSIRTRMIQLMNQLNLNFSKLSFTDIEEETVASLVIEGKGVSQERLTVFIEKIAQEGGVISVERLTEEFLEND